jgi:hypothetical protein
MSAFCHLRAKAAYPDPTLMVKAACSRIKLRVISGGQLSTFNLQNKTVSTPQLIRHSASSTRASGQCPFPSLMFSKYTPLQCRISSASFGLNIADRPIAVGATNQLWIYPTANTPFR